MQPIEYVRSKHWEHRARSQQINVKVCPICSNAGWHFYMSTVDGGPWDCKKCQEKGNLFTLMKQQGDIEEVVHPAARRRTWAKPKPEEIDGYHSALFSDYEAQRYLNSRGISTESIKRFKLGVRTKEGQRWLSIPMLSGSEWANVKYRSLPPGGEGI